MAEAFPTVNTDYINSKGTAAHKNICKKLELTGYARDQNIASILLLLPFFFF